MTKTLEDIFVDARAIVQKGWTQGVLYEPNFTAFCSEGAIAYSIWGPKAFRDPETLSPYVARDDQHENHALFVYALNKLEEIVNDDVPTWNDSGLTSKIDVLDAFGKAIEEFS